MCRRIGLSLQQRHLTQRPLSCLRCPHCPGGAVFTCRNTAALDCLSAEPRAVRQWDGKGRPSTSRPGLLCVPAQRPVQPPAPVAVGWAACAGPAHKLHAPAQSATRPLLLGPSCCDPPATGPRPGRSSHRPGPCLAPPAGAAPCTDGAAQLPAGPASWPWGLFLPGGCVPGVLPL